MKKKKVSKKQAANIAAEEEALNSINGAEYAAKVEASLRPKAEMWDRIYARSRQHAHSHVFFGLN